MKLLPFIVLLSIAVILLIYYLFLIIVGKRTAKLIGSRDKYIWNGLKIVDGELNDYNKKSITLFLDNKNLVFTKLDVLSMYLSLKGKSTIPDAITVPFTKITSLDYKRKCEDSFFLIRILYTLLNKVFKINDYSLYVGFIDRDNEEVNLTLKSTSMESYEFEETFADFNRKVYSKSKVRIYDELDIEEDKQEDVNLILESEEENNIIDNDEMTTKFNNIKIDPQVKEINDEQEGTISEPISFFPED